jgi:hypothetical protein
LNIANAKSSAAIFSHNLIKKSLKRRRAAVNQSSVSVKYTQPPAKSGVQVLGRPRLGIYRLQCVLPAQVLNELMRIENETDVYRTRIAANVLSDWANKQRVNRSGG